MSAFLAMAGLQLGQSIVGGFQQQEHYRNLANSLKQERQALSDMKPQQELARQETLKMSTNEFGIGMEQFGAKSDQAFGDLNRGYEATAGQTGLARSGGLENKRTESRGNMEDNFNLGFKSAFNQYEKGKMNINIEADTAIANIETQMKNLSNQISYAENRGSNYFSNLFG